MLCHLVRTEVEVRSAQLATPCPWAANSPRSLSCRGFQGGQLMWLGLLGRTVRMGNTVVLARFSCISAHHYQRYGAPKVDTYAIQDAKRHRPTTTKRTFVLDGMQITPVSELENSENDLGTVDLFISERLSYPTVTNTRYSCCAV